jgi:hypothetical protein
MAVYTAKTKIIRGSVTATEDSGSVGSVAKAVNDYVETLDATNDPIISISTSVAGGPDNVIVTVVSGKSS